MPTASTAVPVAESLDRETFERDHFQASRPVVLKGALRGWPAFGRWSPDYLESQFAEQRVAVAVSGRDGFDYTAPQTQEMSFAEAAALIRQDGPDSDRHYYLLKQNIPTHFPSLVADLQVPELVGDPRRLTSVNLWFGGAGNLTPLHYDRANNLLAQFWGRKHVTLFDPQQFERLYPAIDGDRPHISRANILAPDYDAFPLLRQAAPLECLLEPGDVLYMPPYWWHQVHSLDLSISVNFWWLPNLAQCVCPAAVLMVPEAFDEGVLYRDLSMLDSTGLGGPLEVARLFLRGGYPWVAALLGVSYLEHRLGARLGAGAAVPAAEAAGLDRLVAAARRRDPALATEEVTAALDLIAALAAAHAPAAPA
jgi:hypothetical protein